MGLRDRQGLDPVALRITESRVAYVLSTGERSCLLLRAAASKLKTKCMAHLSTVYSLLPHLFSSLTLYLNLILPY